MSTSMVSIEENSSFGARLVRELLSHRRVVIQTTQPDIEMLRVRLDAMLEYFERGLHRSLLRPVIHAGAAIPSAISQTLSAEANDSFFQKLLRIEARWQSEGESEGQRRRNEAERDFRSWFLENGAIDSNPPDDASVLTLDVVGHGGGTFTVWVRSRHVVTICEGGIQDTCPTLRINTQSLSMILAADDVSEAARLALYRGQWLATGTLSSRLDTALQLFENLALLAQEIRA